MKAPAESGDLAAKVALLRIGKDPANAIAILTSLINEVIEAAEKDEREACAVVAETPHRATRGGGPADPQRIAAAIRARGSS